MKVISFLLLVFFSLVLADVSPVPFLLWSPSSYFPEQNKQYLETVNEKDVESLLKSCLGFQTEKDEKFSKLTSGIESSKPEIVVIFVEPGLTTDQLSQLSTEYHQLAGQTKTAFSFLKEAITGNSRSSLSFPYTIFSQEHLSEILNRVIQNFKQENPHSKVICSGKALNIQESQIPHEQLLDAIKNSNIGSNDKTDLVVVSFGPQVTEPAYTSYTKHDQFMKDVETLVNEQSEGKYLSIFGADHGSSRVKRSYPPRYWDTDSYESSRATREVSSSPKYWNTGIYEAIIVLVILGIILFIGACCTFCLQSPTRFETPRQRRMD